MTEARAISDGVDLKLADCPFCGSEASAEGIVRYSERMAADDGLGQTEFYFCNCPHCGVDNKGIIGHRTKADAITAWNRRAIPSTVSGETGWQGIASAPKDGTYILVYQTGVLEPSQTVVAFDASWSDDGWWMCCDGKNPELPLRGPEPTHWKPLPANPAETQAVEVGK